MTAVGAAGTGEASVKIAVVGEIVGGASDSGGEVGHLGGEVVEDLPDGRGAAPVCRRQAGGDGSERKPSGGESPSRVAAAAKGARYPDYRVRRARPAPL